MMNRHQRWLLLAILLLALGLRVFRLDGQSLWYDEGTSVALAGRSLSTITRSAAADIHPPFYYYLLHGWTALAGFSPTAVRSLSALIGTALVALTWVLGLQLFGPTVGLTAAFLAAVSPFQVYYSQETRMYILVAMLGALSMVLAFALVKREIGTRDWRLASESPISNLQSLILWAVYIVVSALVLYTHYFGFTVLLAENLTIGLCVLLEWRRRRGFAVRWAVAQVVVVLLYMPWLMLTWRQVQAWPAVSQPFSLAFLLRDTLRVFSLGLSVEPHLTLVIWIFGLFLLLGLTIGWIRNTQYGIRNSEGLCWLFAALYLLVPLATMYLLSLRRPLYNPKFLLLATPPFHLLIALGIYRASRIMHHVSRFTLYAIPVALLITLSIPTARSLHNYYFDPRYARDDYRGIARVVEATARPNDAVLLNAPSQIEVFDYYYDGALPQYPLPRERPPDAGKVRAELEQIVSQHNRIYGIFWATDESDPEGIVENWLNDHAYKAMDAWYGNVRLVLYDVPPAADRGTTEDIGAQLGGKIMLQNLTLLTRTVEAGDVLPLTLRWKASAPIETRYKVFVQLLSPTNQLIAQRDSEPGGGARLTITWQPDETIIDRYGLWVPPGTPPADYRLIAGMYHLETGQRLPVTRNRRPSGDFIDLGIIRVVAPRVPPPVEALNLSQRVQQDYGPVRLLGYSLDKRGAEGQPDVPLFPGDTLRITLFWQAQAAPGFDLELALTLLKGSQVQTQIKATPTDGLYPASRWSAGEVIRDAHDFPLSANLPPGHYRFRMTVSRAGGDTLSPALTIPITLQAGRGQG